MIQLSAIWLLVIGVRRVLEFERSSRVFQIRKVTFRVKMVTPIFNEIVWPEVVKKSLKGLIKTVSTSIYLSP